MDGYMHWKYAERKTRLFSNLPGEVVEIGAGTGANIRYLAPGTRLLAVEPNPHMHPLLAARAHRHGVQIEIRADGAESLPFADDSVDAVLASLVLCTVEDPQSAVQEILRVLRPGGQFICLEHVAAAPGSFIGRLQRAVSKPWRWFFEGCHTHRDTGSILQRAGFSKVNVEPFTWRSVFLPVRPQIAAMCVK
jgi:ubiquinone/menaquinone biosynthesis C-methylase UbiE